MASQIDTDEEAAPCLTNPRNETPPWTRRHLGPWGHRQTNGSLRRDRPFRKAPERPAVLTRAVLLPLRFVPGLGGLLGGRHRASLSRYQRIVPARPAAKSVCAGSQPSSRRSCGPRCGSSRGRCGRRRRAWGAPSRSRPRGGRRPSLTPRAGPPAPRHQSRCQHGRHRPGLPSRRRPAGRATPGPRQRPEPWPSSWHSSYEPQR